jgi:hypothetical protein
MSVIIRSSALAAAAVLIGCDMDTKEAVRSNGSVNSYWCGQVTANAFYGYGDSENRKKTCKKLPGCGWVDGQAHWYNAGFDTCESCHDIKTQDKCNSNAEHCGWNDGKCQANVHGDYRDSCFDIIETEKTISAKCYTGRDIPAYTESSIDKKDCEYPKKIENSSGTLKCSVCEDPDKQLPSAKLESFGGSTAVYRCVSGTNSNGRSDGKDFFTVQCKNGEWDTKSCYTIETQADVIQNDATRILASNKDADIIHV